MGIEKFFNTITKSRLNISQTKEKIYHNTYSFISEEQQEENMSSSQDSEQESQQNQKIECNNFYIDFNSIVYTISAIIETEINYILYDIIINETSEETKKLKTKYNIDHIKTVNDFDEYFTEHRINNIVIQETKIYIKNITSYILDPLHINYIYISFDGTPNMGKIVEQKKRKYMNTIISEMKATLLDKYKETIDEKNKIFNKYSIGFERSNISTYSDFMIKLYNELKTIDFFDEIKSNCINLEEIVLTSTDDTGEGEKKIMEDIISKFNKTPRSYVIYSPDADIIILSLILENHIIDKEGNCKIGMLKKNNFDEYFDYVDCSKLRISIIEYLINKLKEYFCLSDSLLDNLDYNRMIDDIAFIFTVFGNDFLPKIESINVNNGFNIIFDAYISFLFSNVHDTPKEYKYITYLDQNIKKVSYENFKKFMKIISQNEKKLLYESYISIYCKNFNYLSNVFDKSNQRSPYFFDRIYNYINNFNKMIKIISNNLQDDNIDNIIIIIKKILNPTFFIEVLIIEGDKKEPTMTIEYIVNKIFNIMKNGNVYKGNLRFNKYSTTIEDKHHQRLLKDGLVHPNMKINEYMIKLYQLENRLDEYHKLFINDTDTFGYLDIRSKGGYYKLYYDQNIEEGKKEYYKDYFNNQDKDQISREYITGILWLFDFYFNKNNRSINTSMISVYSYKYRKSPFLQEINEYLNKINKYEFNMIFNNVSNITSNYYIKNNMFMNKLEQYLYTTPVDKINNVPERYNNILKDETIFPKMKEIVKLMLSDNSKKYLDCRKALYLNKCYIRCIENKSHCEFMKNLISLRD
jgi:hypothetical protein